MAFRLIKVASSGGDFTTLALAEADVAADGTGGVTIRAILDEALVGFIYNASNANAQQLIVEGSAATRFTSLAFGNGSRIIMNTGGAAIVIDTDVVIVQDLQVEQSATGDCVGIATGAAGTIFRRCYIGRSNAADRQTIDAVAGTDPVFAFCFFEQPGSGTGSRMVDVQGGVMKYCTLLSVDGATNRLGITGGGGPVVQGILAIGTYTSGEFFSTYDAASDFNAGDDGTAPGATVYDFSTDGYVKGNLMAATDGSDGLRDRAHASFDEYTADNVTDADTGTRDVLGNEIDVAAGFRVGAEQIALPVGGRQEQASLFGWGLGLDRMGAGAQ